MDYTNLQVLAEVSITLLGFSGLTAVIGYSRFDQRGIAYRTLMSLYQSSVAFIGSIMPLVGIPILFAAIGLATLMSVLTIWVGMRISGVSAAYKTHPLITGILFPMYVIVLSALWWSIVTLAGQLQFIYELSIGMNLLVATVAFIRLVRSAFIADDKPDND